MQISGPPQAMLPVTLPHTGASAVEASLICDMLQYEYPKTFTHKSTLSPGKSSI
jgi:hypothetical protein